MKLKELMANRKISQAALARKAGISQGLINDYLSEKKVPGAKNIIRLAQALECTADELLGNVAD